MKETIKAILEQYPALYQPLRKTYRTFKQRPILKHLKSNNALFFVQVGSNDGVLGDPIHDLIIKHKNWRGMFIEPVPFLFERLKQNYKNSERFIFENVAISTEKGLRKFYYVSEKAQEEIGDNLPGWYDQLGSFDKNHILIHLKGALEPYIVEEEIETITMPELFERNQIEKIDLLHIDTEGFDYQVLSQIDFSRYKPQVVLYEHVHLSDDEKNAAESILRKYNYHYKTYDGKDTLAFIE